MFYKKPFLLILEILRLIYKPFELSFSRKFVKFDNKFPGSTSKTFFEFILYFKKLELMYILKLAVYLNNEKIIY